EARDNYEIGTLIGDEMDKAVLDLAEDLEDQWMTDGTGNGSKDQTGIIIANDATGTYAGLARATYTFWASVEQAAIGTMALSDVQTVFQTLRNSTRRSKPDLVLCGPPVFDIMANLLDDRVTYMEPGSSLPNGLVLKHGVAAIHWRGAVWTEIPGYTTQRFDAVQSSDWHFDIVRNFAWDPVEIDGDDITTKMTVGMNLVCDHPGRQGHGIGITA
ncbi:MAG: hypothetical protein IMF05_03005, partial [Proteobacteria bacterium]|nr:hypothetical protein [Pseudomonadota bacterium]